MRRCSLNIFRQLVSAYSHVLLQPIVPVVQCRLVVGCRRLRLSSAAAGPRGAPVFPVRVKSLNAHTHIHINSHVNIDPQFSLVTAANPILNG